MENGQRAFEAARIAELSQNGVEADVARLLAQDEWQQMDDAARAWCCQQAEAVAEPSASPALLVDPPGLQSAAPSQNADDIDLVEIDLAAEVQSTVREAASVQRPASGSRASARKAPSKPPKGVGEEGRRSVKRKALQPVETVGEEAPAAAPARAADGSEWLRVASGTTCIEDDHDDDPVLGHCANPDEDAQDMQRAFRASHVVSVGGLHPDFLTEPAAVAQIALPPLPQDMVLRLPVSVATECKLSSPQVESVAYAARRFTAFLPNGSRCGYYLGDGTGCGKGRVIAALVWHLWNSGSVRHVWFSATADLVEDAARDLRDIGADLPISSLSSWSYGPIGAGKGLDRHGNGIMFASYSMLVAESSARTGNLTPDNSRLAQLVDWLGRGQGGANGLIALDEAHRTKNVGEGELSRNKGSKTGWAALELARACPKCAVLYASATGATEIRHLGYLERLGLWGPGRPHASFEELQGAVDSGGLAAMELIAMTMRAEGMLSCRALSFKGTSFKLQQVRFDGPMREVYVAAGAFWQEAYRFLVAASKAKKADARARRTKVTATDSDFALHHRHFWAYQQQFFRQLLICAKIEEAVSLGKAALLRNEAVVISMWSTGEAVTSQLLQRQGAQGVEGFASAPQEIARRLLEKQFEPILLHGSEQLRNQFLQLKRTFNSLKLPPNPLDELIQRFGGPSEVAELTGRSQRLVGNGSDMRLEDRGDGANLEELRAFQNGRKRVAVITEAASAGISLHCDLRLPKAAQRQRYMISIELPWEADKAVQQLGRVHRSNQKVPPKFVVVVSELGGEVRFVSAVARRLRILGAMMRGDRNSAHGAVESLVAFDVQNRYGRRALARFYELLRTRPNDDPEITFSFLKHRGRKVNDRRWPTWPKFAADALQALNIIGLKPDTDDKFDESMNASKSLNVFMNRILMLEPGIQNALFDAVAELYSYLIGQDRADGNFDDGLESLDRQGKQRSSVSVAHREILYKDPGTGAETTYVRLRIDRSIDWAAALRMFENDCDSIFEGFYWQQARTGKREAVLAVAKQRFQARPGMEDDDDEDPFYDLHGPRGIVNRHAGRPITGEMLREAPYSKARDSERAEVERNWKAQLAAAGDSRWAEVHVLSGSILNTWAVVGSALGESSSSTSRGPRKIPLVRAQLVDGGAIVGVRVRPDCLEGVRYALDAMLQQAREYRASATGSTASSSTASADDTGGTAAPKTLPIQELSERLEELLKSTPAEMRAGKGWAGAHALLVNAGLVDGGAAGMLAAQEAVDDLERNGKVDIDGNTGALILLEKQRGCGWWIPPPKKPKTTGRGRGRGRGRGSRG